MGPDACKDCPPLADRGLAAQFAVAKVRTPPRRGGRRRWAHDAPSIRRTKRDASPWTAYAPAFSRPSPLATYHATSASSIRENSTVVASTRPTSHAPRRRLIPVSTSWRRPDSRWSMRAASRSSDGLPRISLSTTTAVSAPRIIGVRPTLLGRQRLGLRGLRDSIVMCIATSGGRLLRRQSPHVDGGRFVASGRLVDVGAHDVEPEAGGAKQFGAARRRGREDDSHGHQ